MNKDSYKQLFSNLSTDKAPDHISAGIESRIIRFEKKRSILRGVSYSITTCLTIFLCVLAIKSTMIAMSSSGFTSYASILLTNSSDLLNSWKELGMVLVESLPILSIVTVLTLIIGSIYSFGKSVLYIKSIKTLQI